MEKKREETLVDTDMGAHPPAKKTNVPFYVGSSRLQPFADFVDGLDVHTPQIGNRKLHLKPGMFMR
jgi:hypothetical protein